MKKRIGILGGMGPEATADLFLRIIKSTPAKVDQDHIRTIIDSNPMIPDRTASILHDGPNPLPEMLNSGKTLENVGADFIIIPCNTAHYYLEDLQKSLKIPVLNMINLAAIEASKQPNVKTAGLLATDGTVHSRIYHKDFEEKGIKIVTPEGKNQKKVMKAIYDHIKKGELVKGQKIIHKVAKDLVKRGVGIMVCGCTEISLVLHHGDLEIPVLDPLQVLSETAVALALGTTNE
jgi:aspartate racemase